MKFKREYQMAELILKPFGGNLAVSNRDYEVFRWHNEDVSLIFYPHKTSAGNSHIRVRDGGSKDKQKADEIMMILDIGAGYNCTFTRKNDFGSCNKQVQFAVKHGLEFGFAEREGG